MYLKYPLLLIKYKLYFPAITKLFFQPILEAYWFINKLKLPITSPTLYLVLPRQHYEWCEKYSDYIQH